MAARDWFGRWVIGWGDRPRRLLVLLVLPLLLLGWGQASPMTHDEGIYLLQARQMLITGDWYTPRWWEKPDFDRTVGAQWLIALCYRTFGYGNFQGHVPSLVAAIATVLLTFAIGRRLLSQRLAFLGALILALTPLWVSYAHLATQDMLLLATELAGLYGLIRSGERSPLWSCLVGASIGLAFLIKGFMVAVPLLAVLPYVWVARRSLLLRPAFWCGLWLGWLPVLLWLQVSIQHWGGAVVARLWEKLLFLSRDPSFSQPWFYYLWNLPANTAPWSLLAPLGVWQLWRQPRREDDRASLWLLLGYPLGLLLLLSLFRTKTPYYGLQLTPFLGLWVAAALERLVLCTGPWAHDRLGRLLWWSLATLSSFLLLGGVAIVADWIPGLAVREIRTFGILALILGLGWGGLVLLLARQGGSRLWPWLGLGAPWLALLLAGQQGLWTDHEPMLHRGLRSEVIAQALRRREVDFQGPLSESKANQQTLVLALAAPHLGRRLEVSEPLRGLTWRSPELPDPPCGFRVLAELDGWKLVQPHLSQSHRD